MVKLLIILLIGLVFEAIGVVLLSQGLKQIGPLNRVTAPEVVRIVKRGAANARILLGVFFEALFFASLLVLMSRSDVSFVWPLTSLGFVLTTLAAHLILKEHVSVMRWCGVCLIMLGAGLITWTEHQRSPDAPSAPLADAPTPDRTQAPR
ncbi:MAG TPA: DMT family transporter [Verrucomicrobiota bacterium]|nr:DMT family transporter [Verrucomicrobiota bacterium]HRZ35645.1 DMT family transporter [Candidatus Paceibacterota bacterium]HRZ56175.1 DMT family transporter [Candidatus Paceibacterota bacterium]